MSTALQPETDGQTECANRVLQEVLRHGVDARQTTWDEILLGVELAMNTSVLRSTGESPLMLSHGSEATLPFDMQLMLSSMKPLSMDHLSR